MHKLIPTVRKLFILSTLALLLPIVDGRSVRAADQDHLPLETAQGWYWQTRPEYSPPAEQLNPLGDPFARSAQLFSPQHLYVGWDAQEPDEKREMIAGVGFDLFGAQIPFDATITRFIVTILERPYADRTVGNGSSQFPTPPDTWLARRQGIVACPWASFFAGSEAAAWAAAPTSGERRGGDCEGTSVAGVASNEPQNPGALATQTVYPWTFDLTTMMADLWTSGENTAFSLEPNSGAADADKAASWTTAFHTSLIRNPEPGVVASVSWIPAPEPILEPDSGNTGSAGTEVTTVILPGGDVASFTQAPPVAQGSSQDRARLTAGVAEGPSARFWAIPFYSLLGALVLFGGLILFGRVMTAEPLASSRPPGATSLLMQGREKGA